MSGAPDGKHATAEQILGKIKESGIEITLEEHAEALTVEAWEPFHKEFKKVTDSWLTRCLFMKDKKGKLFLLVTLARGKTNTSGFAKIVGAKDPRVAGEDVLFDKLCVVKGSVNPFAIINDTNKDVSLCIEKDLLTSEKPVCFHPSDNTKTVILTPVQLKQYFEKHGVEFTEVDLSDEAVAAAVAKAAAKPAPKQAKQAPVAKKSKTNKEGITKPKDGSTPADFAEWYQEVIVKTELISYYPVSGCYILRPAAMGIWREIQSFVDAAITKMGVEPCYFPMFVPKSALEKEKDHVEGFAAEVAWVTKSGDSALEEEIAIRPTSETVMYPAFADWIRSHRDLPLRLNQWCNVVRWEFSHPTPFIRTREFLWQEGHTAHATRESAETEVEEILQLYADVYEKLLAVPVVRGMKTEKEKFAGGDYTKTVEAFIPTVGRSVQGATSHCLGQNFGKMFDISFTDENKQKAIPVQNSWGMTTRTIGVMIMVHGDNKGLVLPPRVAPTQVVTLAVGINKDKDKEAVDRLFKACEEIHNSLKGAGIRAHLDDRDNVTSGNKCNHWELRGIPIRLEVGERELDNNEVIAFIRHSEEKRAISLTNIAEGIKSLLEEIHNSMFDKASKEREQHVSLLKAGQWDEFVPELNKKKCVLIPFCGDEQCETDIKKDSAQQAANLKNTGEVDPRAPSMGAKSLCIPDVQPFELLGDKCFLPSCKICAKKWTLFGRSY